jgi:hypothetical protein
MTEYQEHQLKNIYYYAGKKRETGRNNEQKYLFWKRAVERLNLPPDEYEAAIKELSNVMRY